MKIIATTRTKNEEGNVKDWIDSYLWADEVLVVDGGSSDKTQEIVQAHPHATLITFQQRIALPNGDFFNPQGAQINAAYNGARERGADWIIFDDCDCFPNAEMKKRGREFFETAERSSKLMIRAHRYFIEGNQFYPYMNEYGQSIWAFRADTDTHASERDPKYHEIKGQPDETRHLLLYPPNVLLHYALPTQEVFEKKLAFYTGLRGENKYHHPKHWAGTPSPLPEYAHR